MGDLLKFRRFVNNFYKPNMKLQQTRIYCKYILVYFNNKAYAFTMRFIFVTIELLKMVRESNFFMESLILAQSERWRRA